MFRARLWRVSRPFAGEDTWCSTSFSASILPFVLLLGIHFCLAFLFFSSSCLAFLCIFLSLTFSSSPPRLTFCFLSFGFFSSCFVFSFNSLPQFAFISPPLLSLYFLYLSFLPYCTLSTRTASFFVLPSLLKN